MLVRLLHYAGKRSSRVRAAERAVCLQSYEAAMLKLDRAVDRGTMHGSPEHVQREP